MALRAFRGGSVADVFISYARDDQPVARRIATALQGAGFGEPEYFLYIAPLVTIALNQNGHRREATDLIAAAEAAAKSNLRNGKAESSALLARVYAVEGRKEDALSLLAAAVSRKWLPQPPMLLTDIARDPAFASVKADPRFERSRKQILDTIARMRTQVRVAGLN
jgi:hypothetical protein